MPMVGAVPAGPGVNIAGGHDPYIMSGFANPYQSHKMQHMQGM